MSYSFSDALDQMVREELATGVYLTEDEVLVDAMRALRERNESIAGLQEGLADLNAGRIRGLEEVDAALRAKHAIPRNA